MSWFTKALSGSIGRKIIMAASGLFIITFLIEHLLGNLLLLDSTGKAFTEYTVFMESNILIRATEIILFAGFFFHVLYAIIITRKNKQARPVGYALNKASENSTWFSRNMGLTGSIIFIFLIIHLKTFFVPLRFEGMADESLYGAAVAAFLNPGYTIFYVIAMVFLALHLNHGFQSAFQTVGVRHPKYTPFIKMLGTLFAIVVPALFALIPVYLLFTHQ
ncbi:MAG TPA: succinate dehydrogenase cytochrome b subunit [Candidatus Kapabacteria bacterium]|nr:succinate dehydrogenase cytochrome b subunit [Candidatus Kapabacteria bacterium]